MGRRILTLLVLTFTLTAAAQWHVIDMRHGLAESRIRKICQMHDGRIAIATTATIDVFDGTRFTSYKLLPELAYPLNEYHDKRQLTCDKDGRIWLRNERMLYVVDTRANKIVEDVGKLLKELGLDNKTVAERKQIHCPSTYQSISNVSAMVKDCYGGLWIGTEENGVLYRNERRERQFTTSDSAFCHATKPNFCSNRTRELAVRHAPSATNCSLETSDGYAWLGTRNGLMVFDANDRLAATICSQQGLSTDNVQAITCDKRGDIWIATANGLLSLSSSAESAEAGLL
ncbi:MAG: two-component regulator propeller domain-containing protein [Prevotella sp.]